MAVPTIPSLATDLIASVTDDERSIPIAATGIVPNDVLVVGREMMRVRAIDTLRVEVQRGIAGTEATAHKGGMVVQGGPSTEFGVHRGVPYREGYTGVLGKHARMTYPLLSVYIDPDTGFEYRLGHAAAALAVGSWVTLSDQGTATNTPALASSIPPGPVGVVVDAAVNVGDLVWVLVSGSYVGALAGTIASPEVILGFGGTLGTIEAWLTTQHVRAFNVANTGASAGGLVTVHMERPFINGFVE